MSSLDEFEERKCIRGKLVVLSELWILIYAFLLGELKRRADLVTRCTCLRSYAARIPLVERRHRRWMSSRNEKPRRCLLRASGHNSASTASHLCRLPVYVKLKRRHVSLRP